MGPGSDAYARAVFLRASSSYAECDIRHVMPPAPGVRTYFPWTLLSGPRPPQFDLIWCAHVLEHTLEPHQFLVDLRSLLAPGGVLVLVVPPLKHAIVGGHISLWNMGLLWYRLILSGFAVATGSYVSLGYNLCAVVGVQSPVRLPDLSLLHMDRGDIERLAGHWPEGFDARQGFDGQVPEWNWPPPTAIAADSSSHPSPAVL